MKKISLFFLVLLGVSSFFARFWQLGSLPPILNRDEAALAYNGLLLSKTGLDEWQQRWPLSLESFGDYKLIGYPAILAAEFFFFKPSDMLVRLPAALAGLAIPFVIYFWAVKMGWTKTNAVLGLALVATSPAMFFYSRVGFEANVGLLLLLLALLLSWKNSKVSSLKRLYFQDFATILILALAGATYNTPLLLTPFLIPLWVLQRGVQQWKKWVPLVVVASALFLSYFLHLATLTSQKSSITIFSDESIWKMSVDYRNQFSGVSQKILGNRYVYFGKLVAERSLKSIGPTFMVTKGGDHPWHSLPGFGHHLWPVYVLGLLGLGLTIGQLLLKLFVLLKINSAELIYQNAKFHSLQLQFGLLYLLCIGIIPSVITVDAPHATRSLLFLVLWPLFAVYGIAWLKNWIQLKILLPTILLMVTFNLGWYYFYYFTVYPHQQSSSYQVGFNTIIQEANSKYPSQPIAVIDRTGFMYIVTAWYLKMTPQTFFETQVRQLPDRLGFRYGQQVGNFHFIANVNDRSEEEMIVVFKDEQTEVWQLKNSAEGESL